MTYSPSRPKVHRLPKSTPHISRKSPPYNVFVALALAIIVSGIGFNQLSRHSPELASTQQIVQMASLSAPKTSSDTIIIKDETQSIVGQMAKIPTQNQQITEIKSVSNVDNGSGRELLSIVGKY